MIEEWRSVIGFIGCYEVSRGGRIRNAAGHVLIGGPDKDGYRTHVLCKSGKKFSVREHQVVATAFLGPCPPGLEPNHKDGHKDNNAVSNLEYNTKQQNILHSRRVLGRCVGERHGCAKLSNETADEVRREFDSGLPRKEIAARHGCSLALVKKIGSRKLRMSDHVALAA